MLSGTGAFCGLEYDCAGVALSEYARPLGIPLPLAGLTGFGLLYVVTLFPRIRSRVLLFPLAVFAGLAGAILICIQIFILKRSVTCVFSPMPVASA